MPDSRHCSPRPAPAMPRFELRYRPAAVADLEDIYRAVLHVSTSPVVARRYVERIRDRCRRITVLPQGGGLRDDLAPGLRSVPFERRAVIVYRVLGQTVEITNVFHGGRDYTALYRHGVLVPNTFARMGPPPLPGRRLFGAPLQWRTQPSP